MHTVSELRSALGREGTIGFVPTMGAFHKGHLDLMKLAKSENDIAVVSLFVNPTQFSAAEDLTKYPRNSDQDSTLAANSGVDILFIPTVEEVYPDNYIYVGVQTISNEWEGTVRPTHFQGVATVVTKLFTIVGHGRADFGLKDLQQCAVVRALVRELILPVELRFMETVREESGLAMSSRNTYLSEVERSEAAEFYRQLLACREKIIAAGVTPQEAISEAIAVLSEKGFKVDYLEVLNPITMKPDVVPNANSRLVGAAKFCSIRLLDNVPLIVSK
ncbi:MAG: pantoate--beta-alanine ligase [Armatimonadetes bacterium]|nr:pantoate--beta-alanine ligase [Armatimonadota bacterium]